MRWSRRRHCPTCVRSERTLRLGNQIVCARCSHVWEVVQPTAEDLERREKEENDERDRPQA